MLNTRKRSSKSLSRNVIEKSVRKRVGRKLKADIETNCNRSKPKTIKKRIFGSSITNLAKTSNYNETWDESENTLDSDIWKDDFDKLLEEKEPLRKNKVLKKVIRSSYNFDSSLENENTTESININKESKKERKTRYGNILDDNLLKLKPIEIYPNLLDTKGNQKKKKVATKSKPNSKKKKKTLLVSTPTKKKTTNLFDATLSPINNNTPDFLKIKRIGEFSLLKAQLNLEYTSEMDSYRKEIKHMFKQNHSVSTIKKAAQSAGLLTKNTDQNNTSLNDCILIQTSGIDTKKVNVAEIQQTAANTTSKSNIKITVSSCDGDNENLGKDRNEYNFLLNRDSEINDNNASCLINYPDPIDNNLDNNLISAAKDKSTLTDNLTEIVLVDSHKLEVNQNQTHKTVNDENAAVTIIANSNEIQNTQNSNILDSNQSISEIRPSGVEENSEIQGINEKNLNNLVKNKSFQNKLLNNLIGNSAFGKKLLFLQNVSHLRRHSLDSGVHIYNKNKPIEDNNSVELNLRRATICPVSLLKRRASMFQSQNILNTTEISRNENNRNESLTSTSHIFFKRKCIVKLSRNEIPKYTLIINNNMNEYTRLKDIEPTSQLNNGGSEINNIINILETADQDPENMNKKTNREAFGENIELITYENNKPQFESNVEALNRQKVLLCKKFKIKLKRLNLKRLAQNVKPLINDVRTIDPKRKEVNENSLKEAQNNEFNKKKIYCKTSNRITKKVQESTKSPTRSENVSSKVTRLSKNVSTRRTRQNSISTFSVVKSNNNVVNAELDKLRNGNKQVSNRSIRSKKTNSFGRLSKDKNFSVKIPFDKISDLYNTKTRSSKNSLCELQLNDQHQLNKDISLTETNILNNLSCLSKMKLRKLSTISLNNNVSDNSNVSADSVKVKISSKLPKDDENVSIRRTKKIIRCSDESKNNDESPSNSQFSKITLRSSNKSKSLTRSSKSNDLKSTENNSFSKSKTNISKEKLEEIQLNNSSIIDVSFDRDEFINRIKNNAINTKSMHAFNTNSMILKDTSRKDTTNEAEYIDLEQTENSFYVLPSGKWRRTLYNLKKDHEKTMNIIDKTIRLNETIEEVTSSRNLNNKSNVGKNIEEEYQSLHNNSNLRNISVRNSIRLNKSKLYQTNLINNSVLKIVPELSISECSYQRRLTIGTRKTLLLESTDDDSPKLAECTLFDNFVQNRTKKSKNKRFFTQLEASEFNENFDLQQTCNEKSLLRFSNLRNQYNKQFSVPLCGKQQSFISTRCTSVIETTSEEDLFEPQNRKTLFKEKSNFICPISLDVTLLVQLNPKDNVLRHCNQTEPLEFSVIYSEKVLNQCRKIGEGVYGEVFMNKNRFNGEVTVLKIIPIAGSIEVNGEIQKNFEQILPEIIIAKELSNLRYDKKSMTTGFVEVKNIHCVQGKYPDFLLDKWELYEDNHGTENDHPKIFSEDQLYVVFELANAGQDLESYKFQNAAQTYSVFSQIALSLAVAESKYKFEHRDLHWGNVLVFPTDDKQITFKLNGKDINIETNGVKATIIDYTLSRMIFDGCCLFNDLSDDNELFSATGDYQYEIYRLMKQSVNNDWGKYEPFTNVLWLHYIIDKIISGVHCRQSKTQKHCSSLNAMKIIRDVLLEYKSASDYVENFGNNVKKKN